jgi:mRNA-degrading endonuclease toxin of MazEF toxin-antitoxin module
VRQLRSIAVQRVGERLAVVPNSIMLDIDEALRLHLGL